MAFLEKCVIAKGKANGLPVGITSLLQWPFGEPITANVCVCGVGGVVLLLCVFELCKVPSIMHYQSKHICHLFLFYLNTYNQKPCFSSYTLRM